MSTLPGDPSVLAAARAAAMSAAEAVRIADPEWVSFTSRSVVLVTGKAARVMATLAKLPPPLRVVAFVPDAVDDAVVPRNVRLVAAPILDLTGHLGCFAATTFPSPANRSMPGASAGTRIAVSTSSWILAIRR